MALPDFPSRFFYSTNLFLTLLQEPESQGFSEIKIKLFLLNKNFMTFLQKLTKGRVFQKEEGGFLCPAPFVRMHILKGAGQARFSKKP